MMREELQSIYESSDGREEAEAALKKLCSWIMHSKLEPMKKFCKMLREHWDEILNYFDNKYTNAILEGINSIIQNIKRRARGFRNEEYFPPVRLRTTPQTKTDFLVGIDSGIFQACYIKPLGNRDFRICSNRTGGKL